MTSPFRFFFSLRFAHIESPAVGQYIVQFRSSYPDLIPEDAVRVVGHESLYLPVGLQFEGQWFAL